jgi:hypothetical protein
MRTVLSLRSIVFMFLLLIVSGRAFGQIEISVGFAPPALPVYEQPVCPGDGYLWTPGYWDYADDDYFWVPGTWVEPPEVGFLWTPGYWGWGGSAFIFHRGYWGEHVGFYGGVSYGFGYFGNGYEGGRWDGGHFFYNRTVNNVNVNIIHNTYNTTIVNRNETRVSYNGGEGGINARESEGDRRYASERHIEPVGAQVQHREQAAQNRDLRASVNHGKPAIAATARPSDFHSGAVAAREAGAPYKAPERNGNAARGTERPANENHPGETHAEPNAARPNPSHASEVEAHKSPAPNSGNAKADQKYQQQQQKLEAKQAQDHQKLQQQQEREHQQATKKNYNDAQKQQMEQRHQQQTQQMEQKHTQQTQRAQPRPAPQAKPEARPEGGKPH